MKLRVTVDGSVMLDVLTAEKLRGENLVTLKRTLAHRLENHIAESALFQGRETTLRVLVEVEDGGMAKAA